MDPAILEKEALNLPKAERALLADRLLQSLGAEDGTRVKKWADESERRLMAVREDRLAADDAGTVLRRLRAKTSS